MTTTSTTANLQAIFTYPFKNPNWKSKAAIATVICLISSIIPIIPMFFFFGYCYRLMKAVIVDHETLSLPEWDDWGRLFADGAKIFGISLSICCQGRSYC